MVYGQTGGAWVNGWCRRFFKWVGEREREREIWIHACTRGMGGLLVDGYGWRIYMDISSLKMYLSRHL